MNIRWPILTERNRPQRNPELTGVPRPAPSSGMSAKLTRFAIGDAVRFKWAARGGGMDGKIVSIRSDRLFVRLDAERWREMSPIPATADELEPVDDGANALQPRGGRTDNP